MDGRAGEKAQEVKVLAMASDDFNATPGWEKLNDSPELSLTSRGTLWHIHMQPCAQ